MLVVWLCLVHKNIILSYEETNRPSTEMFVEMVIHRVYGQWHHVIRIFYEFTCNLASFAHLSRLAVEENIVSHRPFVLCVRLSNINCQETNFILKFHIQCIEIADKLVKRGSGI